MIFSSIRHPQGNIVERVIRELGRFFRTFVGEKHTSWFRYIDIIHTCINEVIHDSTEMTPMELHFNIKPGRIWRKWIKFDRLDNTSREEKICLVQENLTRKAIKREGRFNEKHKFTEFKLYEKVRIKANNVSDGEIKNIEKFFAIFEGPYIVKQRIGLSTYLLQNKDGIERGTFNVQLLKKYLRRQLQEEVYES